MPRCQTPWCVNMWVTTLGRWASTSSFQTWPRLGSFCGQHSLDGSPTELIHDVQREQDQKNRER